MCGGNLHENVGLFFFVWWQSLVWEYRSAHQEQGQIGGLQPISRDTDNNASMYNCWWTNKRSLLEIVCFLGMIT